MGFSSKTNDSYSFHTAFAAKNRLPHHYMRQPAMKTNGLVKKSTANSSEFAFGINFLNTIPDNRNLKQIPIYINI